MSDEQPSEDAVILFTDTGIYVNGKKQKQIIQMAKILRIFVVKYRLWSSLETIGTSFQ